jgi:RNA polymerase sigma factor FliA
VTRNRLTGLDLLVRPHRVEASLWRRLRFEAEIECREALFNRYVGLARQIAVRHLRRRAGANVERAELEQLAYEGLLHAIDRFDPMKGVPFSAFARRRIRGNIIDGISRLSEVNAQISHRRRIEQERLRSLSADVRDAPGDALAALSELAVELALGIVLEGTALIANDRVADPGPTAYESLEWRQLQARLAAAVARLPGNEAQVVRQHYDNGLSFAQIAVLLDLSRGRISQLHRSALARLSKSIGRSG